MQQQKKRLLLILAVTIAVVSVSSASGVITFAPSQLQIAMDAPIGLYNSNPSLIWEKTWGGTGDDRIFCAANACDGFVVVGSSTSFEKDKTVACIVRLDHEGNLLWNRTFSENYGVEFRYVHSITDGFIFVGNTFFDSGNVDGIIVKLDTQGTLMWNITLRVNEGVNKLFSGMTYGETIVAAGLTQQIGNETSHTWIVKLDQNGTLLWSITYGKSAETAARAVTLTQDNCYMTAGYIDSDGNGNYDFLVLKLDDDGNLLWNKTYGGPQSDKAYAITSSVNSCVIVGDANSKGSGNVDAWIIKIDVDGNLLWDQTAGGTNFDSPTYITISPNGGYLVTGTTFSFGNGQREFWLFKINEEGKVFWSCTVGRSGYEEAYAAVYAGGNEYALAGWTNSIGSGGMYDFYVVKIKVQSSEPQNKAFS